MLSLATWNGPHTVSALHTKTVESVLQLRYVRVAAAHAGVIPRVMRTFLGDGGLGHAHAPLATRACYLLMRIIKVLRPSLKGYLGELIEGLVPRVQAVAEHPVHESAGALKGTSGRGAPLVRLGDEFWFAA